VTEIGNAMGFVRMIRSGGYQYISNAIKYVPDLQDVPQFQQLATTENLPQDTIEAAK
jgi:WASH complex subunit 7